MTPSQLKTYLNRLIQQNIKISTMIGSVVNRWNNYLDI